MKTSASINSFAGCAITASVSSIEAYERCPRAYREKHQNPGVPDEYEAVGNIVDRLWTGGDAETLDRYKAEQLSFIPEAERATVAAVCADRLEKARSLEQPGTGPEHRKVRLRWFDPEIEITIYGTPDLLRFFREDGENSHLLIADLKTAMKCTKAHRKRLIRYGLLASLAYEYDGPIVLEVQLAGSGEKATFGYNRVHTKNNLAALRKTLLEMKESWEDDEFPARTGPHCQRCKYRAGCEKGQEHVDAWGPQDPQRSRVA